MDVNTVAIVSIVDERAAASSAKQDKAQSLINAACEAAKHENIQRQKVVMSVPNVFLL